MPKMLITGGAGFLGVNAADHFARAGWAVTVLDNLSRPGSERNLDWLRAQHRAAVSFLRGDLRDRNGLNAAVRAQDAILHLAAQVAVTSSIADPQADFEVNVAGTLNLLEAVRSNCPQAVLLYASTNKIYGSLQGRRRPIDEDQPLDFRTPYGCSKGAADQYVRDYARSFGLRTVVFRQSCIYGPHQYGTEDQGWVAHFVHSIAGGRPITIYGDGNQVRDLLDVRDLCRLYALALEDIDECAGQVFNVGGGPTNARCVLEVIEAIAHLVGVKASCSFSDWRPGDQRYYVSNISRAELVLGWRPEIDFETGLSDVVQWAQSAAVRSTSTVREAA